MKVKWKSLSRVQLFVTPWIVASTLLCPWDLPGQNSGVGSYSLLQGIFPTQGLNLGLLHGRQILYFLRASLIAQLVKNLPAMQKTPVQFLSQEDPLEKGLATHSSILGLPL